MKIKIIILFLLFQFVGCQKKIQPTSKHSEKKTEQSTPEINFINYPIDDFEGITSTKYNGIYRSFDFKYTNGETMFILSPKSGNEKWYSEQENKYKGKDVDAEIEKNLNQQSFKLLSNEFDVWVFHTPKENMKKTPKMDAPYTPLIPRKIFFYKYDSSKNNWSIVNTYSIENEKEEAKANEWQESNIVLNANNWTLFSN
ncbi:hypothetical protein [Frigoriflavimonas asaccharolytica]|uniref:Uncharacterized protein n=1 Tax=Frigoriflavimonas asaccharolytica TaxID=2735899 RepID=A0A8J8K9V5_9FLAO|nr:hypothetical protein [Frigoriflavimonas asaccharolytica]NRS94066.1 hypothetical protein [Frigoriflavimonas asaccharolytica]